MTKEVRRITMDIDRKLWHQVGIESAKLDINKKDFVEMALREKIERINDEVDNGNE